MPWIGGVAAGVGALISSSDQSSAASSAANAANGQNAQTQANEQPWLDAGKTALGSIGDYMGTSGNTGAANYGLGSHQFNASDLNSSLAPNYQFMLDQGLGATTNAANASGFSGNALQGIGQYAENYAGNAYQQAFSNYTANQTNTYNRLANLAGLGQTANQVSATAGTANTANANNYLTGGAAATAAGTVGASNAISNAVNNNMGWNYLNSGGSGTIAQATAPNGSASGGFASGITTLPDDGGG